MAMKIGSLSVFFPAYNEEKTIFDVVKKVIPFVEDLDDDSNDIPF